MPDVEMGRGKREREREREGKVFNAVDGSYARIQLLAGSRRVASPLHGSAGASSSLIHAIRWLGSIDKL